MTVTLTVYDPGCGFINLNERMHWRVKARLTKQWRTAAALVATADPTPQLQRAHILVTFHKNNSRKYDVHNLLPTVKAAVDGLVDAGVIPDDDNAHLIGPDLRAGDPVARTERARLVITITPWSNREASSPPRRTCPGRGPDRCTRRHCVTR
jgi:crossover junction endodeoxyribonuclease RusA